MPQSLPMLPEDTTPAGANLFYTVTTGTARDRKVTLEAIRKFCTQQGVRLLDVTLAPASAGAITTVDVSGTTNVVVMVWGHYPAASDPRVDITGSVPDGCAVTVYSMYEGLLDLLVQGARPSGDAEGLDLGQYGRADLIGRSTALHLTAVNDSRYLRARLSSAVAEEAGARTDADAALAAGLASLVSRVDAEEDARSVGDAGLSAQLTAEVSARVLGDAVLQTYLQDDREGLFDTGEDVATIVCGPGTWEICGSVSLLIEGVLPANTRVGLRVQINDTASAGGGGGGAFDERAKGDALYISGAWSTHRVTAHTGRFIFTVLPAETRTLYLVADATIPGGPLPGTWTHRSVLNARQIVASA